MRVDLPAPGGSPVISGTIAAEVEQESKRNGHEQRLINHQSTSWVCRCSARDDRPDGPDSAVAPSSRHVQRAQTGGLAIILTLGEPSAIRRVP